LKKEEILKCRGNDSVFTLFIEVDEPVETFNKISYGHFFYSPSRKGLGDLNRKEMNNIIDNFENYKKEDILSWLYRFLKYNNFEISIPAIRDRNLTCNGKTGLIVSFMAEYQLLKKMLAGLLSSFQR